MKTKNILLTAALAAFCASPAFAAQDEKKHEKGNMDEMFIMKAADGGMAEVELGRLASQNGESSRVKEFGEHMTKDHTKANDELKAVAAKMNVTVPEKVGPKNQATMDKLSKLSGAKFDEAYGKAMVKDHMEDIAEFEKAANGAKNPELKAFAGKTLPTLKEHLKMAKELNAKKSA